MDSDDHDALLEVIEDYFSPPQAAAAEDQTYSEVQVLNFCVVCAFQPFKVVALFTLLLP
jgi:hypothetical protein